jgi:hypothetical protein
MLWCLYIWTNVTFLYSTTKIKISDSFEAFTVERVSSEEDSSRGSSKEDSREGQVKKTPVEGRVKKTPERVK